jgi:drug/metabolite transporter (DMT)-like permease
MGLVFAKAAQYATRSARRPLIMNSVNGHKEKAEFSALCTLIAGALCTGGASILVRLSETGPTATAFWRGCLALPLLALWALFDTNPRAFSPKKPRPGTPLAANAGWGASLVRRATFIISSFRDPGFLWAGAFFAGDLALWHWSLLLTSVAASTLEASLAPIAVTLIVWLLWRERPSARFVAATALALAGMVLIVSPKLGHGGSAFAGDALGLGTAVFYAAYILAVAGLRARHGTGIVMFNSTLAFTVFLLPLALTQKFAPDTLSGWAIVAGCAVAAQVLGQGLIAYALAHLRPTFSSLGLLVQTLGASISAWLVLGERLAAAQIVGGLVIIGAIAMARSAHPTASAAEEQATAAESLGVVRD